MNLSSKLSPAVAALGETANFARAAGAASVALAEAAFGNRQPAAEFVQESARGEYGAISKEITYGAAYAQIGPVEHNWTNISTDAVRFAAHLGLSEDASLQGTEVNAMRHTLWQGAITSRFGPEIAQGAGALHETNPGADLSVRTFTGPDALAAADQTIDLLNNRIGRGIGEAMPGAGMKQIAGAVLDHFHAKGLYTRIESRDGSVHIVRSKLSQLHYQTGKMKLEQLDENGFEFTSGEEQPLNSPSVSLVRSLEEWF